MNQYPSMFWERLLQPRWGSLQLGVGSTLCSQLERKLIYDRQNRELEGPESIRINLLETKLE